MLVVLSDHLGDLLVEYLTFVAVLLGFILVHCSGEFVWMEVLTSFEKKLLALLLRGQSERLIHVLLKVFKVFNGELRRLGWHMVFVEMLHQAIDTFQVSFL